MGIVKEVMEKLGPDFICSCEGKMNTVGSKNSLFSQSLADFETSTRLKLKTSVFHRENSTLVIFSPPGLGEMGIIVEAIFRQASS